MDGWMDGMDGWDLSQTTTTTRAGLSDIFFKDTSDMYTILGHIGDMYTIYNIFEEPHFRFHKNPRKLTRTFASLTVLTVLTVLTLMTVLNVLTVLTVLSVPTILTVPTVQTLL